MIPPRWILIAVAILGVGSVTATLHAEITGSVIIDGTGLPGVPVEGAEVRLQADDTSPVAVTDALGRFTLPVAPAGTVEVAAALAYDVLRTENFNTAAVSAEDGDDIVIRLRSIPTTPNASYTPIKAAVPAGCGDCHGEQLAAWSPSAHARSAQNVWVQDLYSGDGTAGGSAGYVFKDANPGEPGFCATCHAPVAEAQSPGTLFYDEVQGAAELEGVTCSACHQLDHFSSNSGALHLVGLPQLGLPEPGATFRFPLDGIGGAATHEFVWGPLPDVDYAFMRASYAPVFAESAMCASCHEYVNPENGTPGQTTYSEWLSSSFAVPGAGFQTCQDCHMPEASEPGPIADPVIGSAPTRPATERHDHGFTARPAGPAAIDVDVATAAVLGQLVVHVAATNRGAGHAFPTGISLRNAILLVRAELDGTPLQQVAGPTLPSWADDDQPGKQDGDWAGFPGLGFAKVLSGEVAGIPTEPVIFFDADTVASNTTLAAGETRAFSVHFALPPEATAGQDVNVDVRLIYRRAWRALVVTKGWTENAAGGPIEEILSSQSIDVELDSDFFPLFADGFESGGTSAWDS